MGTGTGARLARLVVQGRWELVRARWGRDKERMRLDKERGKRCDRRPGRRGETGQETGREDLRLAGGMGQHSDNKSRELERVGRVVWDWDKKPEQERQHAANERGSFIAA